MPNKVRCVCSCSVALIWAVGIVRVWSNKNVSRPRDELSVVSKNEMDAPLINIAWQPVKLLSIHVFYRPPLSWLHIVSIRISTKYSATVPNF